MNYGRTLLPRILALAIIAQLAPAGQLAAQSLLKRGGIDVVERDRNRFGLDLTVGVAGADGSGSGRLAVTVTPRYELRRFTGSSLDLALPVVWIPSAHRLPWPGPCPELDRPFPAEDIFAGLGRNDLELGQTLLVAPSLEWSFCTGGCLRPSIFAGAGIRHDRGRTTTVGERGTFATADTTSPVLTFGFAVHKSLKPSLALRLELRAITTFYDQLEVTAADGSRVEIDGDPVTSGVASIGLHFSF